MNRQFGVPLALLYSDMILMYKIKTCLAQLCSPCNCANKPGAFFEILMLNHNIIIFHLQKHNNKIWTSIQLLNGLQWRIFFSLLFFLPSDCWHLPAVVN